MLEALAAFTKLQALVAAEPARYARRATEKGWARWAWLEGRDSELQWITVHQGNKNPLRLGIDKKHLLSGTSFRHT